MKINIEFTLPFTRRELRPALADFVLPAGATVTGRQLVRNDLLTARPNAEDDGIDSIKIDGFATLEEIADFLKSLPAGSNGRILNILIK